MVFFSISPSRVDCLGAKQDTIFLRYRDPTVHLILMVTVAKVWGQTNVNSSIYAKEQLEP